MMLSSLPCALIRNKVMLSFLVCLAMPINIYSSLLPIKWCSIPTCTKVYWPLNYEFIICRRKDELQCTLKFLWPFSCLRCNNTKQIAGSNKIMNLKMDISHLHAKFYYILPTRSLDLFYHVCKQTIEKKLRSHVQLNKSGCKWNLVE
jgi:hypothetical protein